MAIDCPFFLSFLLFLSLIATAGGKTISLNITKSQTTPTIRKTRDGIGNRAPYLATTDDTLWSVRTP